jgi:hypothetical protein
MSNKTLWISLLCILILTTGFFAWKNHKSHELSKSLASKVPDINCALDCPHEMNLSPTVPEPKIPIDTKKSTISATTTNNTCLEAVTLCLSHNGDLLHCVNQTSCTDACRLAIQKEVLPEREKRLDKLNILFLSPGGACHTP